MKTSIDGKIEGQYKLVKVNRWRKSIVVETEDNELVTVKEGQPMIVKGTFHFDNGA